VSSQKLLLVEDDPHLGVALKQALATAGYQVRLAQSGAEGIAAAAEEGFDLLLQDVQLPDAHGLDILRQVLTRQPQCRALVMTAYATVETAVEAMKLGAFDFMTKPFPVESLLFKIARVLEYKKLEQEFINDNLRGNRNDSPLVRILTRAPVMIAVKGLIAKVAPLNSPVLLQGESGVGKELLAEVIHGLSPRRDRPIIKVNCATIPTGLFEAELFGVTKGAYTGADTSRPGLLEQADGGTIFLDEIAELPLPIQGKLLRVLEDKLVVRVGAVSGKRVDFRIISSSSDNLRGMAQSGAFRDDLFFRLGVVPVHIPPLRERREDIPLLTALFLSQFGRGEQLTTLSAEVMDLLARYRFPGNVRELRNLMEKLSVLRPGETILPRHMPAEMQNDFYLGTQFEQVDLDKPLKEAVAAFEQKYIERVLDQTGGQKSLSARILGLSRKVLWEKLKRRDG
jgi:DNA-binding NtrC family response regulator